jgi:hypothetical protein
MVRMFDLNHVRCRMDGRTNKPPRDAGAQRTGRFMIILILLVAIGLSIVMMLAWAYQRRVGNAGWVDVFWTAGLGLAGVAVALAPIPGTPGPTSRQALIAADGRVLVDPARQLSGRARRPSCRGCPL